MEVYRGEVGTSKNKILELKAARESGVSKAAEQVDKELELGANFTCLDLPRV